MQKHGLIAVAVVEKIFAECALLRPSPFHARPSLEAASIPLYQRDCVLLI
jgi:hypothetical protein